MTCVRWLSFRYVLGKEEKREGEEGRARRGQCDREREQRDRSRARERERVLRRSQLTSLAGLPDHC